MDVNANPDPGGFWTVPEPIRFFLGLDLGQRADFTALAILEKHGIGRDAMFHCRHLQRFKLNTSYPQIICDVRTLCLRPPLADNKPQLAIDGTGVGNAVVEMFTLARPRLHAAIEAIVIHGGEQTTREHGIYRVPKRELVSVTQAALQTNRLRIAADLPEANTLVTELQNFQVTISDSGHDSYDGRVGQHDDLVLALAMALWLGLHQQEWGSRPLNL